MALGGMVRLVIGNLNTNRKTDVGYRQRCKHQFLNYHLNISKTIPTNCHRNRCDEVEFSYSDRKKRNDIVQEKLPKHLTTCAEFLWLERCKSSNHNWKEAWKTNEYVQDLQILKNHEMF